MTSRADALAAGERVFLRHPVPEDLNEFLSLVRESRRFHQPWVQAPITRKAFLSYAERAASERFFGCLFCLRDSRAIVGAASLSEIVRGLFQSAYLGYYAHVRYAGHGLMKEGLQLLLRHAFKTLKLHRIEANIQPGNTDSLALVRSLGFHQEGFSQRYLKIGGRWRDHERWALLRENWKT